MGFLDLSRSLLRAFVLEDLVEVELVEGALAVDGADFAGREESPVEGVIVVGETGFSRK